MNTTPSARIIFPSRRGIAFIEIPSVHSESQWQGFEPCELECQERRSHLQCPHFRKSLFPWLSLVWLWSWLLLLRDNWGISCIPSHRPIMYKGTYLVDSLAWHFKVGGIVGTESRDFTSKHSTCECSNIIAGNRPQTLASHSSDRRMCRIRTPGSCYRGHVYRIGLGVNGAVWL